MNAEECAQRAFLLCIGMQMISINDLVTKRIESNIPNPHFLVSSVSYNCPFGESRVNPQIFVELQLIDSLLKVERAKVMIKYKITFEQTSHQPKICIEIESDKTIELSEILQTSIQPKVSTKILVVDPGKLNQDCPSCKYHGPPIVFKCFRKDGELQLKSICPKCKAYIKFVPKVEPWISYAKEPEEYFELMQETKTRES